MTNTDPILATIAKQHLGIPTLETRKSDRLDFHDVAVWGVKAALQAAFDAGAASANSPPAGASEVLPIIVVTVRGGLIEDLDATIPVHAVVEDHDVADYDTGKKPARSVWELTGGLSGPKAERLRRLIAND